MNFSRSTILVAAAVLLAACGDKVTVTQYTPPPTVAKVYSVEVAPATATVNTGASLTFTAAVNADAGVATTVTWSASAGTITTAGVFTAPATANAGIAVCATSTVDTGKKGCATVVVSPPIATIPATVSINSITATGNLNGTVNPAAVAGGIDVTLNVNPGNQTVTKVELWVGGILAGSQSYTAAQAAALRYAADQATAAQTVFPQVVIQVNTAGCGTTPANQASAVCTPTNATPTWSNVAQAVQAKLYTSAGGSTSAASASASVNLTFANANTYILTSSASGTPATGANGYKYSTGSISTTVTPIIYTTGGLQLAAGTITFGAAGCDATGPRTIALTVASGAGTATFTKATGAPAATNFRGYELRTAVGACPLATGEGFAVTAVDNNGNQLFTAAAPANNAANLYRMDNVSPGVPTLIQNPGARQNGWVNGAVLFTTTNASSAANGMTVAGAADAGIGGYIYKVRIGAASGGLVDGALAATATSTPTIPAPSAANNSYCAVFSATDALGNESTLPAAGAACSAVAVASNTALAAQSTLFGVDIAAPTIAFSGGLASNAKIPAPAAAVGAEFQVTVSDTGVVGNSGMLTGSAVLGTVVIRNATGASPVCFIGVVVSGVCTSVSVNAAPAFPLVATTTVAASATNGYYTYTAVAQDAAGNQSGTVSRVALYDNVPATLSTASVSLAAGFYTGGVQQTFSSFANDNIDIANIRWALNYGDGAGVDTTFDYGVTSFNAFNGSPLQTTNVPVTFAVPFFVRQLQGVTGNAPLTLATNGKPSAIIGTLNDQTLAAANAATNVTTAIPAASVAAGGAPYPGAGGQLMDSWAITSAAANAWDGAGANVAANPASRTVTVTAAGPTATFNAPFSRVDFYAQLASGRWTLIGTATSYSTTDNGAAQGRKHSWSISFTPGLIATWAANPVPMMAVGANANGDALTSPTVANITIVP